MQALPRRERGLRQGPEDVRRGDLRAPDGAGDARRHGHRHREPRALLYQKAAWNLDNGVRDPIVSSFAKAFAPTAAMQTAIDAVQVFGGNGYVRDLSGGEADARRQALQILRRHEPGSAPGDRPRRHEVSGNKLSSRRGFVAALATYSL